MHQADGAPSRRLPLSEMADHRALFHQVPPQHFAVLPTAFESLLKRLKRPRTVRTLAQNAPALLPQEGTVQQRLGDLVQTKMAATMLNGSFME